MPEAAVTGERARPAGVSELALVGACQDCSLVSIWEPVAGGDHPHSVETGHEMKVAGLGDLPSDRQIEVPGGGADGD